MRPLVHAVVAGGGMAGLLAARVLADHFERVTLIEPDQSSADPRKGVPQGRHVHVLLIRGRSILERYFTGLAEELKAAGAVLVNAGRELGWHHAGNWRVKHDSELSILCISRPSLEHAVAERVANLPNITVSGTRVEGLVADGRGAVCGVRSTGSKAGAAQLSADLVVDASGRGSATPRWIAELGFAAPETDLLPVPVAYASCTLRRPKEWPEFRAFLVTGTPAKRAGTLVPIEGDRWLLTLASYFEEPSPGDHDEMLGFARSLSTSAIYDVVRRSEPLSGTVRYRFAGSQRRRYDALDRFPEGLIVIGDGICSFNPVYGQGMTVAAIEAECLDRELERARQAGGIGADFGHRWFQVIQPVLDAAWDGVLLEDLRFPELARQRPARMQPLLWYMDRVHRATCRSPVVADQFYRVANFLDPPTKLFHPKLAVSLFGRRS